MIIHIAEDYRQQRVTAEARKLEFETMGRENYEQWINQNTARLLALVTDSGLSEIEAKDVLEDYKALVAASPKGSDFDDVGSYIVLRQLVERVEHVCKNNRIPIKDGVVFGAFPSLGVNAFLSNVPTTQVGMLCVSSAFVPFFSILSKLMTKLLLHRSTGEFTQVINCPVSVKERLDADPMLTANWALLFGHAAVDGWIPRNLHHGQFSVFETATRIMLVDAIGLFVVAHEYGHHIAGDGEVLSSLRGSDPKISEYNADLFARGVSMQFGSKQTPPNLYAASGVGAVIALGANELIDRAQKLLGVSHHSSDLDTHPSFEERILNIASLDQHHEPAIIEQFKDMRDCFKEILEVIWIAIRPSLVALANEVDFKALQGSTK